MAEKELFNEISEMLQLEAEIYHIINGYIKTLFNAKWKIADEITEWSEKLINQIREHVAQQKNLLDEEYRKKVSNLNILRDQLIAQALIYEEKKNTEQINQLLNQCNTLKVELATIFYIERPIPSIQLITEEQLMQQDQDGRNEHKAEDEKFRKKLVQDYDNDIINNTNATESLPSKVPSTHTKQKNRRLLIMESSDEKSHRTIYHDDSVEECPICSMVFPSNMAARDPSAHVNEHFPND